MNRSLLAITILLSACAVSGGTALPYQEWEDRTRDRLAEIEAAANPSALIAEELAAVESRELLPRTCYKAAFQTYVRLLEEWESPDREAIQVDLKERLMRTRDWC